MIFPLILGPLSFSQLENSFRKHWLTSGQLWGEDKITQISYKVNVGKVHLDNQNDLAMLSVFFYNHNCFIFIFYLKEIHIENRHCLGVQPISVKYTTQFEINGEQKKVIIFIWNGRSWLTVLTPQSLSKTFCEEIVGGTRNGSKRSISGVLKH